MFAYCILGLATGLIGPALLDIAYTTRSSIQQYTFVFFGRACGYLLGVVISGQIFHIFDEAQFKISCSMRHTVCPSLG